MTSPKLRQPEGWYRLPRSGAVYFGPLPDGAEVLDGPPAVEAPAPPALSAPKAAWVSFAVSQGWSPEDATRKSKAALVAELGQESVDPVKSDSTVGPEVAGVDLTADPLEVLDGPADVDGAGEELDGDLDGHPGDAT